MNVKDFYYDLPHELIAQDPLEDRSSSRLLVLSRQTGELEHKHFSQILDYLTPQDCLVINNTRVIPARLFGEKEGTRARIELLLLKRREKDVWETLVKPGKKARPGARICFGGGLLAGEILDVVEDGNRLVRFTYEGIFEEILDRLGQMPLPPYITHRLEDKERYQTVYAKYDGSAAAPTAGLHFTTELLDRIRARGIPVAEVTLHVGLGTFRPVKVEQIQEHHMHSEYFELDAEAASVINETKRKGGRVFCVGTTSCRVLESVAAKMHTEAGSAYGKESLQKESARDWVRPCSGWTDIFIYPGYQFQVLDALITNFHLPESTLVMLVSALAGRENILHAYERAVEEKYRFFSFGDAMLIV